MKKYPIVRSLVLLSVLPLSYGESRSAKEMAIEALSADQTFVDGFRITGVIDRNRPGISIDRKRFVAVGQPLDASSKTVLVSVEYTSTSMPRAGRWNLTFERQNGERFLITFPKSRNPQTPNKSLEPTPVAVTPRAAE